MIKLTLLIEIIKINLKSLKRIQDLGDSEAFFSNKAFFSRVSGLLDGYRDKLCNVVRFAMRVLTSKPLSAEACYLCKHP